MQENPIPAIEKAELAAKQTVQKANEDKSSLIRSAQEEADRYLAEAIRKAQTESNHIIQTAEQSVSADVAAGVPGFEKEKTALASKAKSREGEVVKAILEIISEKTS